MSIKPDVWIKRKAESEGMIEPFSENQVRVDDKGEKLISYGVSKTLVLKKSDDLINPTEGLKTEFIESIGARLGYKISLAIESGDVIASPAFMHEQEVEEQLNQDKSSLLENPVLKDILDSFDGKIIDESITKVSS